MQNHVKGKVYYVCFYSEKAVEDKIVTYPSAIPKIDYVMSAVKEAGKKVVVFSIAPSLKGRFRGCCRQVDDQESRRYISSRRFDSPILNRIAYVFQSLKILFYLFSHVKKEDKVLVYHSLYNRIWLIPYLLLNKKKVILQIEDVFSEIDNGASRFRDKEWSMFRASKKCLCVNDILMEKLDTVSQKVVSYGSYALPPLLESGKSEKIRIVYAGVIEQSRNAAFLAVNAVRHLPDEYELHILGFGKEDDIIALKDLIEVENQGGERIFFHGRMSGDAYTSFLQTCHIALSTHSYDSKDDVSANYTFPSKVLTYLANNLRVVAQRLTVLEKSQVSTYISYYDHPVPEDLAEAIKRIDLRESYDSRWMIEKLDKEFKDNIEQMLEEVNVTFN